MNKTITASLAFLAITSMSTSVAMATDIPSKRNPVAPAPTFTKTNFYVGGNVGGNFNDSRAYSAGAVAGWNINPFLAVEGTYDVSRPQSKVTDKWNYGNTVMVNVVPQYKVPGSDFTVYALGGVGYRWNSLSPDYAVYNVGGGVKYEIAKNIELDARYRRIDSIEKVHRDVDNRVTFGINFLF